MKIGHLGRPGMLPSCSLMIGNLGENYHTAMETYNFVKEIGWEYNFRFFLPIPYPKTEIFAYGEKNGLIKNELKLIKSFKSEDNELIRVNFSELSNRKLLQLKKSLEVLLNNEQPEFIKNYHINRVLKKMVISITNLSQKYTSEKRFYKFIKYIFNYVMK